jgi:hypothetical protein
MKTYKEMIWELALNKAHRYYSGGAMMSSTEQEETVAWIFEVTLNTVYKDILEVYPAACAKVSHG